MSLCLSGVSPSFRSTGVGETPGLTWGTQERLPEKRTMVLGPGEEEALVRGKAGKGRVPGRGNSTCTGLSTEHGGFENPRVAQC